MQDDDDAPPADQAAQRLEDQERRRGHAGHDQDIARAEAADRRRHDAHFEQRLRHPAPRIGVDDVDRTVDETRTQITRQRRETRRMGRIDQPDAARRQIERSQRHQIRLDQGDVLRPELARFEHDDGRSGFSVQRATLQDRGLFAGKPLREAAPARQGARVERGGARAERGGARVERGLEPSARYAYGPCRYRAMRAGAEQKTMTTAMIVGVSGQDGAFLAELLLGKGYQVWGTSRDCDGRAFANLSDLGVRDRVELRSMDALELPSILAALEACKPDEIYNLGGQSSVGLSFDQPIQTMNSIVQATQNLLEALRTTRSPARFYSAGSSECFGDTGAVPANEDTRLNPRSPYAVAKASAYWQVASYREAYGLFAVTGLLFNHESRFRPARFVTSKIIGTARRIAAGSDERLALGDVDIVRDWGLAEEFVEAMWRMLQQPHPATASSAPACRSACVPSPAPPSPASGSTSTRISISIRDCSGRTKAAKAGPIRRRPPRGSAGRRRRAGRALPSG